MRSLLSLTLMIAIGLTHSSCKKKETYVPTKTDYLTQKSWTLVEAQSKNSGGVWEDIYPFIDTCRKDNIIRYSTVNTYTIDEGLTKCYAVDPQIMDTGSWAFQNNETQLVLKGNQVKDILILNNDTLKYYEIGPSGWSTYEAKYTFTH